MSYSCLQHCIDILVAIDPSKETIHLGWHTLGCRRLIMNFFFAHSARNYLYVARAISAYIYAIQTTHSGREQYVVPPEKPVMSERLIVVLSCIQLHFYYTLDIAGHRHKSSSLYTQPASY